jgi:hypothetical protein
VQVVKDDWHDLANVAVLATWAGFSGSVGGITSLKIVLR